MSAQGYNSRLEDLWDKSLQTFCLPTFLDISSITRALIFSAKLVHIFALMFWNLVFSPLAFNISVNMYNSAIFVVLEIKVSEFNFATIFLWICHHLCLDISTSAPFMFEEKRLSDEIYIINFIFAPLDFNTNWRQFKAVQGNSINNLVSEWMNAIFNFRVFRELQRYLRDTHPFLKWRGDKTWTRKRHFGIVFLWH